MQVLIIETRRDASTGELFKTVHKFNHSPVELTPGVAGWDGSGAGLSTKDLSKIHKILNATARNIFSIQIELCEE